MDLNNVDEKMLLPILKQIPLFSALDENSHMEIIKHIILMYYPENYEIFKENDVGDALYIIKRGSVKIFHTSKNEDDKETEVALIQNNGFFGEMALISDVPRNASAKTTSESEIFILSKDDFKKLLDTNQTLAEQVSATVVARIKDNEYKN